MHLIWEQIHRFAPEIDPQSEYGRAWSDGIEALGRAQDEEGMAAFKQAADAFINAFENHPERPEALMGLSYLLVLLGDELSAMHYVQAVLERHPVAEARELLEMLESSHRLNSLLEDVERLFKGIGFREAREAEVLSPAEANRLVEQTELLLQIQHALLVVELNQGQFKRLDQLNSRQRSLETLFDMLSAHLTHFLEDQQFGNRLQKRLDILAFDLESLQNLENLFEDQRVFQKEVQALFRELTRHIINLRMKKASALNESRTYLQNLKQNLAAHVHRLDAFPPALRRQVESASGWNHLQQQAEQLENLIESTSVAVG